MSFICLVFSRQINWYIYECFKRKFYYRVYSLNDFHLRIFHNRFINEKNQFMNLFLIETQFSSILIEIEQSKLVRLIFICIPESFNINKFFKYTITFVKLQYVHKNFVVKTVFKRWYQRFLNIYKYKSD